MPQERQRLALETKDFVEELWEGADESVTDSKG